MIEKHKKNNELVNDHFKTKSIYGAFFMVKTI